MTLNELIERLQDLVTEDEANGQREVRIAHQPTYPLQSTLQGVCTSAEAHRDDRDDDRELDGVPNLDPDDCVYVVEGSQVYDRPYAPRGAFEVAQ